MHAVRRKGKARSRILYWFRTPPGVRVGRAALDEDAIRLIEERNPGLQFDWTRILKGQTEAPAKAEAAPEPPRPPRPDKQERQERRRAERHERHAQKPAAAPTPAEPLIADPDQPVSAAQGRLGAEGLLRLRGRYAEMLARISDRIQEPERQEELKALAERLNPDAWVTEDDVIAGLESYEVTFESVRSALGPRRPRQERAAEPTPSTTTPDETLE